MKDNNANIKPKKLKKQDKEKKILKLLKLSRASYKNQHIVNGYLMNEIIALMEKISDWQEEDEENIEKIKRELINMSEWEKIKEYLEDLWRKND